jgi:hypothetical protein
LRRTRRIRPLRVGRLRRPRRTRPANRRRWRRTLPLLRRLSRVRRSDRRLVLISRRLERRTRIMLAYARENRVGLERAANDPQPQPILRTRPRRRLQLINPQPVESRHARRRRGNGGRGGAEIEDERARSRGLRILAARRFQKVVDAEVPKVPRRMRVVAHLPHELFRPHPRNGFRAEFCRISRPGKLTDVYRREGALRSFVAGTRVMS